MAFGAVERRAVPLATKMGGLARPLATKQGGAAVPAAAEPPAAKAAAEVGPAEALRAYHHALKSAPLREVALSTASHEAGHCVAALYHGVPVRYVDVTASQAAGPRTEFGTSDLGGGAVQATIALSGCIAEELLSGQAAHIPPWKSTVWGKSGQLSDSDWGLLKAVTNGNIDLHAWDEYWDETRGLLTCLRPQVEQVADLLRRRGIASGPMLEAAYHAPPVPFSEQLPGDGWPLALPAPASSW